MPSRIYGFEKSGGTQASGAGVRVPPLALSPDGHWLVFGAIDRDGQAVLWLRAMDGTEARPLLGSANARYPFWSPDSRTIGFMTQGELKTTSVAGGAALKIMDLDNGDGGSWGRDGTILVSLSSGGMWRTSADGRPLTAVPIDHPGADDARLPWFMPDGRHFLMMFPAATHLETLRGW